MSEAKLATSGTVTVVTPEGGLKFSAEVRGHSVPTDQPLGAGGQDNAVTPLELMGVALGSCIALYVTRFCATRSISTTGLQVEVAQQAAKTPYRVSRYEVRLRLPDDFPAAYREMVERAAQSCPVHNTLIQPPEIRLEVQTSGAP